MSDTFNHEADAWESLIYGEEDDSPSYWTPRPKTCNRCGKKGLFWKKTPKGWRLAEKGVEHICMPLK